MFAQKWAAVITVPLGRSAARSEEHTSELQSQSNLVCRLLLEKKKKCTEQPGLPKAKYLSGTVQYPGPETLSIPSLPVYLTILTCTLTRRSPALDAGHELTRQP